MKKSELIKALQAIPGDPVIILQKDAEGNGYSPLAGCDGENSVYLAETTWYGEVMYKHLTEELKQKGFGSGDVVGEGNGEDCVVLWPIN